MRAFTVVELLVVGVIVLILAGFSLPPLVRLQSEAQVKEQVAILVSDLRLAASDSRAGWQNDSYGVYIASDAYTVYKGLSYANRDQSADRVVGLAARLSLVTELSDGGSEIVFNRRGLAKQTGKLKIMHQSGEEGSVLINDLAIFKE